MLIPGGIALPLPAMASNVSVNGTGSIYVNVSGQGPKDTVKIEPTDRRDNDFDANDMRVKESASTYVDTGKAMWYSARLSSPHFQGATDWRNSMYTNSKPYAVHMV